ncbi:MAG: response regulator [Pirellulaceae bacterium]|nr:response regulator [Pirellulaceae bacterium]
MKPKILCFSKNGHNNEFLQKLEAQYQLVTIESLPGLLGQLQLSGGSQTGANTGNTEEKEAPLCGVLLPCETANQQADCLALFKNHQVLESMSDGVALLDTDQQIVWANRQFRNWCEQEEILGESFYKTLNSPEIIGPSFCPLRAAVETRKETNISLKTAENLYYQVQAAPLLLGEMGEVSGLVLSVRDVTRETLQQQKLAAIHKAGIQLADMTTKEVYEMEVSERIEFLKSNILHYTQDLLKFDVVEIRLLNETNGLLENLLSVGIDNEEAKRPLEPKPTGNGVTGFVCSTGKSYLCEDTTDDPLYIKGCTGARSSLTVPLILHEHVIGTFNVESPKPNAFSQSDLQFLEIFSREVAAAINTMQLLEAEKTHTTLENIEAIHRAVALPVDEILNDVVQVLEENSGKEHSDEVKKRLHRLLENARDIKTVIQAVGKSMAPLEATPVHFSAEHPHLLGCRILVVDDDGKIRSDAHELLEPYGCVIETAPDGLHALRMVRNLPPTQQYHIIISDVRLTDMRGYELYTQLKDMLPVVPMVLMTGFGYDPGHSIVKAREAGLHPNATLFKPFRLDQLLGTLGKMLEVYGQAISH